MAEDRQPGKDDLDRRIQDAEASQDLEKRIHDAQKAQRHGLTREEAKAENRGWAVGAEFVVTTLVSGFIGFAIDRYAGLGTAPWAMIVFLILGFIAGTRRAMKTSAQFDADPTTGNKE